MSMTEISQIVAIFEKEYNIHLTKLTRKKIIYAGKTKNGKSVTIITPASKIYVRGNGWVDFTKIQIDILKQYQISIAVFRLDNEKNYFVDMNNLYSMLSQSNMMKNEKEGEHWKLDIWADKIIIRNGGEELKVKPNDKRFINLEFTS